MNSLNRDREEHPRVFTYAYCYSHCHKVLSTTTARKRCIESGHIVTQHEWDNKTKFSINNKKQK